MAAELPQTAVARAVANVEKMTLMLLRDKPEHTQLASMATLLAKKDHLKDAAIDHFQRALASWEASQEAQDLEAWFGPFHLNELGCLQSKHKLIDGAHASFTKALMQADKSKVSQVDKWKLLPNTIRVNMIQNLKQAGRVETAVDLCSTLIPVLKQGGSEEQLQGLAYDIADMFNDFHKFKEAEPFAREALRRSRELYAGPSGEDAHPQIVSSLCMVAAVISSPELGKWEEAEALVSEALRMAKTLDLDLEPVMTVLMQIRAGRKRREQGPLSDSDD